MNTKVLSSTAGATTVKAGILHLVMTPNILNFSPNGAILFSVGGAAQIFWAVPMIRRWGRVWYSVGIGGTLVLIAIWTITRMPGSPITGRGAMVNEMGIAVEAMQWVFVDLTAAIIMTEYKMSAWTRRLRKIQDK